MGKMYWTDWLAHKIGRANLDGSASEDVFIGGMDCPDGIGLDLVSEDIYFTDFQAKKIQRGSLDSFTMEDLVMAEFARPNGIVLGEDFPTMAVLLLVAGLICFGACWWSIQRRTVSAAFPRNVAAAGNHC